MYVGFILFGGRKMLSFDACKKKCNLNVDFFQWE